MSRPPTPAPEAPAEEEILEQTWARLANHDLAQHLANPDNHVRDRAAWLRTAIQRRRATHEQRARAELAGHTRPLDPVDLAEILDPACGPDDGGAARAAQAAADTAARAQAARDRATAIVAWTDRAEHALASMPAEERSALEQRAEASVPARAPARARVVHGRLLQLAMGEDPDAVAEAG